MAVISATVSSTSITLNDGVPFKILSATGMGGAEIRRVTVQGPTQDGDTDTGYRLAPREIELVIGFQATTDALLDGYRDTLTSFFKPLPSTPIKLRIVRDDGEIRQIDCNLVGSPKIDLLKEHRPGHYHRCTVRLRAPDPAWYELAPGTATFAGSVNFATNWWLAGGAIGTAQVLMHGGTPANDETWSYAGTLPFGTTWTIAMRAGYVATGGTEAYLVFAPTLGTFAGTNTPKFGQGPEAYAAYSFIYSNFLDANALHLGTLVYFYNYDTAGLTVDGVNYSTKVTSWITQYTPGVDTPGVNTNSQIVGTAMKWRTSGWSGAIPLYALYSPALGESQRITLSAYMNGTAGTVAAVLPIAYEGDLPEYPVITLTGPIAGPIITNTATGEEINFGTYSIGAGTTYVIDTRYGYKSVLAGTVSKLNQLSAASDWSTWHLSPAPLATGGTNMITLSGSSNTGATSISIVYYNRFMSF